MAHRAFGQPKENDGVEREPITFDLAEEKGIMCRKFVNGKLLIELVGKVDSGSVKLQSEGILQVFDVAVLPTDGDEPDKYSGKRRVLHNTFDLQEAEADDVVPDVDPTSSLGRLTGVLDDPETEISVDELAELVGWLVEQYTDRPTGKSGNSPGGRGNTRPTSRRARRSQARTIDKEARHLSATSSTESS